MEPLDKNLKLIFISSFPPRECGIATFTQDLANTLNTIYGCTLPIEIYALENKPSNFIYACRKQACYYRFSYCTT